MNRRRIAPLGIALALALAATAASAARVWDPVAGTWREEVYLAPPAQVTYVERTVPAEVVVYDPLYAPPRTTVVAEPRYVYVEPRERIIVQADRPFETAFYDPMHAHWGHLIDRGLFNRRGPNDFGR